MIKELLETQNQVRAEGMTGMERELEELRLGYEEKKKMLPILKNYATKTGYKRGAKNFIKEVIQKLSKK